MENAQELPYRIDDDIGNVVMSELQCPGVYYVAVERVESQFLAEFYIVEESATDISAAAKSYGKPLSHHPELLSFEIGRYGSGSTLVKYEVARYRKANHMPSIDEDTLLAIAVYGAEDYPDYFGRYVPPSITPRGTVTRYKELANGVFLVETDRCAKMLAVCYPIWHSNFSSYVIKLSEQTKYDKTHGIDNTLDMLSEEDRNAYQRELERRREAAENELQTMDKLKNNHNILAFHSHKFVDWQDEEEERFGCDLLIRMDLMQCLRGRNGQLTASPEDAVKVGIDVCKALAECHRQNIIHRDVKPENIFMNSNGEYMLGDFGISRSLNDSGFASTGICTEHFFSLVRFLWGYSIFWAIPILTKGIREGISAGKKPRGMGAATA